MRGADAGARAWIVTIQAGADGTDESGFPIFVWSDLAQVPAKRTQGSASEVYAATGEAARIVVDWAINYRADCDPDLVDVSKERRVLYRGRVHDVIAGNVTGPGRAGIVLSTVAVPGKP